MKIIFAGTPDFAVPSLQALIDSEHELCAVYTQPDRPAGRGRQPQASPVKQLALQHNIPVLQPLTLKTPEALAELQAFNADLMIVVAYGMILSQAALDVPRLGCINVHGSLLPRWRGAAPIQRAIISGDKTTGVTIMRMALKLDAGAMLHKEAYIIKTDDTASSVHDALAVLGALGLNKVLPKIIDGSAIAQEQDESLVTYAEKLQKSEADIDWSQTAEIIDRKIRGLNAWPVAQTHYKEQVLRIWQAELIDSTSTGVAGLVSVKQKHIDVQTGKGVLRLQQLQLPNGKRIDAGAFLNAHSIDGVVLS
ncbi:MAG: methionyl-tRNA formyltransferase [Methylococcaceae bacterium]